MPHGVFQYLSLIKQRILEELAFLPHSTLHAHLAKALESKKNGTTEMCTSSILIAKALKDLDNLIQERTSILSSALFDHATISLSGIHGDETTSDDSDSQNKIHKQTKQLLDNIKKSFADCLHAFIDSLLSKHLDILYDRHVSVIMISSSYFLVRYCLLNHPKTAL